MPIQNNEDGHSGAVSGDDADAGDGGSGAMTNRVRMLSFCGTAPQGVND